MPVNAYPRQLFQQRHHAAAAQRRRQIADWLERYERLVQTPARSDDELLAKHQALALMEQARPELSSACG